MKFALHFFLTLFTVFSIYASSSPIINISNATCVSATQFEVTINIIGIVNSTYTLTGDITGEILEGTPTIFTLDLANAPYNVTVTDNDFDDCNATTNILSPNCNCPTGYLNSSIFSFCGDDAEMDVSLGGATGLTITDATNLDVSDADGDGVDWFLDNPPTSPYIPGNLTATDMCGPSHTNIYAFLRCDANGNGFTSNGDDSYILAGSVEINVYPDISALGGIIENNFSCNLCVLSFDCEDVPGYTIVNDFDGNGSCPDFSAALGSLPITWTVANTNYTGLNTACQFFTIMGNYNCTPCPSTVDEDTSESICDGDAATLPTLTIDNANGETVFWQKNDGTTYNFGDAIDYPYWGNGCTPEIITLHAFIWCDDDNDITTPYISVDLDFTHIITVYPNYISSYITTIGENTCTTSVLIDLTCLSFINITNENGTGNTQTEESGSGNHNYTISYNYGLNQLNCIEDFSVSIPYSCIECPSLGIDFLPEQCAGIGTLDLDNFDNNATPGIWSITPVEGAPTLTTTILDFSNALAGTYVLTYSLITPPPPPCPPSISINITVIEFPYCQDCPSTIDQDASESICSGNSATLPTLTITNPNGEAVFWQYEDGTAYNFADAITYPVTGNGCAPETLILKAFILCDDDDDITTPDISVNLDYTHTITVYPEEISAFISTTGENTCTTSVLIDTACVSFVNITNENETGNTQTEESGSGNHEYAIAYNDGTNCIDDFIVSVPFSCDDIVEVNTDLVNNAFSIYPTITTAFVFLNIASSNNNSISVMVYTIDGSLIENKNVDIASKHFALDVSNYANGTYYIQINDSKTVETSKFVKY